ncbi:MAG: hypothetical protein QOF44_4897 [Streptomyces sp.]|nr:hypothetical protein [Streptomyces sp.]
MARSAAGGVLVRGDSAGDSWAYVAFRLSPSRAAEGYYPELSQERRRAATAAAERDWLADLWTDRLPVRWELRHLNDPADGRNTSVLFAQVLGADPVAAERAAEELCGVLGRPPGHAVADRVTDSAEIERLLAPFTPRPGGIAEIRKLIEHRRLTRAWHNERYGIAVARLDAQDPSWEAVWTQLARYPRRAVVSVCLEPCVAPAGLSEALTYRAQAFGVLAAPGPPDPLFGHPVPGDPFAAYAEQLYLAGAERYRGPGPLHRIRVSVATEGPEPVPVALTEPLARTLSPTGGAVVRVPRDSAEWHAACANLLGINRLWQEETYWQEVPEQLRDPAAPQRWLSDPGLVASLSDLVDADEASAAFRLPHEEPGTTELFAYRRQGADGPRPVQLPRPAEEDVRTGWETFQDDDTGEIRA